MTGGVDVLLDLESPNGNEIIERIGHSDVVICNNLLEHVSNRDIVIERIKKMVKNYGVIIVTQPNFFKYHPSPIDTMYRPTDVELEKLFPKEEFAKIKSAIIEVESGPLVVWTPRKEILRAVKYILRKFHMNTSPERPVIIKNKVSALAMRKIC